MQRHYEIIFLVHPDQSEQVPQMIDKYRHIIINDGGMIHRCEDCGRRQLAYPINRIFKAHYVILNVECDYKVIENITSNFRFNDAVLRHLVLNRKYAITAPSFMAKTKDDIKKK